MAEKGADKIEQIVFINAVMLSTDADGKANSIDFEQSDPDLALHCLIQSSNCILYGIPRHGQKPFIVA